jgi:hypothetical protein
VNVTERRRYQRRNCDRPIIIAVGEGQASRTIVGRVADVSDGGFRAHLPQALARGTRVEVIELPPESAPDQRALTVEAQVAWVEAAPDPMRRYQHGFAFLGSGARLVATLLGEPRPSA